MDDKNSFAPMIADSLTPILGDVMVRLVEVISSKEMVLPRKMLLEIQGISIVGADPMWQLSRLNEILDRWASVK
jgi:pyruvate formate-lyase activating enzyme-like uncharacterized protein